MSTRFTTDSHVSLHESIKNVGQSLNEQELTEKYSGKAEDKLRDALEDVIEDGRNADRIDLALKGAASAITTVLKRNKVVVKDFVKYLK